MPSSPLAEPISSMRRSDSVSDDTSVIGTNDDATYAKLACVKAGYYVDDFIQLFCGAVALESVHREPEIKQGYWARVRAIELAVRQFCTLTNGACQIISLGAGFDTLYWRLMSAGVIMKKYIEVDFCSVTARKISHIMRPSGKKLKYILEQNTDAKVEIISSRTDMNASPYHLLGADIRQLPELKEKLESVGIDYSLPTLVIVECVLVYMTKEASNCLLKSIANTFEQVAILNYDQINTDDMFSEVMRENLRVRHINLVGSEACHDAKTQIERFNSAGFDYLIVKTMQDIWKTSLAGAERDRVEKLEFLDEAHLREQLFHHYCLVYAAKCAIDSPLRKITI